MRVHIAFEKSAPARFGVDRGGDRACHVGVLCDDASAALPWLRALQAEGIVATLNDTPSGDDEADADFDDHDALVLLVHQGGLPAQLSRVRELRQAAPSAPLIVACGGLRELDQILALELGADDVLDTALSAPVIAARLRALWRRRSAWLATTQRAAPAPRRLQFGALLLALDQRRVTLAGRVVELTEGEFEVLWLLAAQAGQTLTRHELLKRVRGLDDHPLDRSIDSRIYRIRAKLGDNQRGAAPRIRTVRNRGYVFSPADW